VKISVNESHFSDPYPAGGGGPQGRRGTRSLNGKNHRSCAPSPPPPFGHLPLRGRSFREAAALTNKFTTSPVARSQQRKIIVFGLWHIACLVCFRRPHQTPHGRHEHPRRAASSDDLLLRPADRARPPDRSLAPGPARAHADPVLYAHGQAGRTFHQLAAGPAGQSPRPPGVPGTNHRVRGRGRSRGRHVGDQPVRLLPGARGREIPFRLRSGAGRGDRALSPAPA